MIYVLANSANCSRISLKFNIAKRASIVLRFIAYIIQYSMYTYAYRETNCEPTSFYFEGNKFVSMFVFGVTLISSLKISATIVRRN